MTGRGELMMLLLIYNDHLSNIHYYFTVNLNHSKNWLFHGRCSAATLTLRAIIIYTNSLNTNYNWPLDWNFGQLLAVPRTRHIVFKVAGRQLVGRNYIERPPPRPLRLNSHKQIYHTNHSWRRLRDDRNSIMGGRQLDHHHWLTTTAEKREKWAASKPGNNKCRRRPAIVGTL